MTKQRQGIRANILHTVSEKKDPLQNLNMNYFPWHEIWKVPLEITYIYSLKKAKKTANKKPNQKLAHKFTFSLKFYAKITLVANTACTTQMGRQRENKPPMALQFYIPVAASHLAHPA